MLELFPGGFEEVDAADGIELAAYTDAGGEERMWAAFGVARAEAVSEDWAERWRRFHRPARIGPLWVGPPWEPPPPDALAVVIDPGRAFGTGSHPTTRLCLELLLDVPRGSVLDIGCGSGVLAIAATRLGFAPVVAVDVDPTAVETSAANAAANRAAVDVRLADARVDTLPEAEVALVNVSLDVVHAVAPRIEAPLMIASGYLASDEPRVAGRRSAGRRERDGWAADLLVLGN
jgi:ribosomal protein L11 methyltransferase